MLVTRLASLASLLTAAVLAAAHLDSAHDSTWKQRQAKRNDVVSHLQNIPRHLRARQSPIACSTIIDLNGNCCTFKLLATSRECCTQDDIFTPYCGNPTCCDDGVIYGQNTNLGCCRFPAVTYTPPQGTTVGCCATGQIAPNGLCCEQSTHIEGDVCVRDAVTTPVEPLRWQRDLSSSSRMAKRSEASTRTLLSPDLIVEHLLNNGIFSHQAQDHIDHGHRAHNEGVFRRLAGRGIAAAVKYAFRPGMVYDAERWNAVDFVPISDTYEMDIRDVPEIYARIVSRPDFEVFHWRGAAFDRDVLYRLAHGHPGYNATLVEHFRK